MVAAPLGGLYTCATQLGENSPNSLWHRWASGVRFLAQGNNSNRTGILGIEPGTSVVLVMQFTFSFRMSIYF